MTEPLGQWHYCVACLISHAQPKHGLRLRLRLVKNSHRLSHGTSDTSSSKTSVLITLPSQSLEPPYETVHLKCTMWINSANACCGHYYYYLSSVKYCIALTVSAMVRKRNNPATSKTSLIHSYLGISQRTRGIVISQGYSLRTNNLFHI